MRTTAWHHRTGLNWNGRFRFGCRLVVGPEHGRLQQQFCYFSVVLSNNIQSIVAHQFSITVPEIQWKCKFLHICLSIMWSSFPGNGRISPLLHLSPLSCLSFPPPCLSCGAVLQQQPAMLRWLLAGRWGSAGNLSLTAGGWNTGATRVRDQVENLGECVPCEYLQGRKLQVQSWIKTTLNVILQKNVLCYYLFYNSEFDAFNQKKSVNSSPSVEVEWLASVICAFCFVQKCLLSVSLKENTGIVNIVNRPYSSTKSASI